MDTALSGSAARPHAAATLRLEPLGQAFARAVDRELRAALALRDEARLDPTWRAAQARVLELALRPAKRVRPWLVVAGHALAGGPAAPPRDVWRFAAAVELLHTFVLVHDDVADRSELRRGGPALHRALAPLGPGEDLAVVAGDHLFARALELMLECGAPHAARATRYYLATCRHTAAGQLLDLCFARRPLAEVTPFHALAVAHLKTARYSFAAPLASGALLAGAPRPLVAGLERVGRHAGLAFQLRDDLIGTFGDPDVTGKPADGDLAEGKRTFPLLVAWRRASGDERRVLESLGRGATPEAIARAREIVASRGGRSATERAISRATRAARRALDALPAPRAAIETFSAALERLAGRVA